MVTNFWIVSLSYCSVLGVVKQTSCQRTYPIDGFIRQIGEPQVKVLEPKGFTITVPVYCKKQRINTNGKLYICRTTWGQRLSPNIYACTENVILKSNAMCYRSTNLWQLSEVIFILTEDQTTKFVEFYVNVNIPYIRNHKPIEDTQFFGRSFGSNEGFVYTNSNVTISKNDTIYYWLMVATKDNDLFPKMKYTYIHT